MKINKNRKKILIISSYYPYFYKENWIHDEVVELSKFADVAIVPRSAGKKMSHSLTKLQKVICVSLFSPMILIQLVTDFLNFVKYIPVSYLHSIDLWDFVKRTLVIPKALYVARCLKSACIDHIHIYNTTSAATMGVVIAQELKVPYSYTLHTVSQLNDKHKRTYYSISRDAKFVRSISASAKDSLVNYLPFECNVIVNHLGINLSDRNADRDYSSNRIVMVSALEEYKRVDIAIRAIKCIVDAGVDVHLDIYGEGSLNSTYAKLITELGLNYVVHLRGVVERKKLLELLNTPNLYSIILLTSRISKDGQVEGIPVALMEGMASGLIAVSSSSGATRELIVHGLNGFIFDSDSPAEISGLLMKVMNMSCIDKRALSNQARGTINQKFNTAVTAKLLYESMR